jgi:hypothetical protein
MDAGDKRYFCADINCDVVINATKHGVKMAKPLLTQEVVDARMREDKEAGLREYHNIFTHDQSEQNICKRADIIRNSVPRIPDLKSKDNKTLYAIAYDPARLADCSVIGIAEYNIYGSDLGIPVSVGSAVNAGGDSSLAGERMV